ncbi:MAG: serine/threonine protein kinase [Deltaproteobacteria bacterium]|nr:MAG: serine/threonine protein kinase [Deltaproteobacteria bacterium]
MRPRRRSPSKDVGQDLPRLPEVGLHEESNEVDLDPRTLQPVRGSLSGARELPVPPPPPRSKPPTPPRLARAPMRPPMTTPRPPPRSAAIRAETAEYSSLIGGRYQILTRIGQGGMGKVYKVKHTHLSRTFALKIISNQVAETDEARELFYREARFASAMSHPNITSVVDFGEDEKVGMFMVMELVDGEALNRILFREKQLSARKACDIVLQVAEALHYIHKQGVVHCDIKTENILISEEEHEGKRSKTVIKLLDFGLARSLNASRASTSLSGTPHYVAPERIRGEPASPASDVYGVGILLYELVTGQVPWDGPVQRDPDPPRARQAAERAPQGHGRVHLRAQDRDGHDGVRPAHPRRPRQARRDRAAHVELAQRTQRARRARPDRVRRLPPAARAPDPARRDRPRQPRVRAVRDGRRRRGRQPPRAVHAAGDRLEHLRSGPRPHPGRQPGPPHHRDRRRGRRVAPAPALARRRVPRPHRPRRPAPRAVSGTDESDEEAS